jgi:hypothetical protein
MQICCVEKGLINAQIRYVEERIHTVIAQDLLHVNE